MRIYVKVITRSSRNEIQKSSEGEYKVHPNTNFADKLLAAPRANSPVLFGPSAANIRDDGNNFQLIKPSSAKLVWDKVDCSAG
jgi:hypothetical protein